LERVFSAGTAPSVVPTAMERFFSSPRDGKERVELVKVKGGVRGQLVAIVKETRQSRHIGDFFHGAFPKTPKVGEKIILGEGTLFFQCENTVGVNPDDGRDTLWLDIEGLYKAHEQTVTLCFKEFSTN